MFKEKTDLSLARSVKKARLKNVSSRASGKNKTIAL
jgi:hypothetical protein